MQPPARRLLNCELEGGWKVIAEVALRTDATGSCFSAGYIVQQADGQRGFLKALDYSGASRAGVDTAQELKRLTTEFLFERGLVERCIGRRFSRVVRGLAHGRVVVAPGLEGTVEYLIFELAAGDIRKHIAQSRQVDLGWRLRVLHHVATGLFQLHSDLIAHQDIKPSNILVFDERGSKICDLGRAASLGETPPHDDNEVAGDRAYAPPELLYGDISTDWKERRLGCDIYQLGSLTVFLLASANMTALLLAELDRTFHPRAWQGAYQDVLPLVQQAYGRALEKVAQSVPSSLQDRLMPAIASMCDPDPKRRGHPVDRRSAHTRYSCQRYVSLFNLLATESELQLRMVRE